MSDMAQPWVECERLQHLYWASIRRCASAQTEQRESLEEADRLRVFSRNALQDYKDRACPVCPKCLRR